MGEVLKHHKVLNRLCGERGGPTKDPVALVRKLELQPPQWFVHCEHVHVHVHAHVARESCRFRLQRDPHCVRSSHGRGEVLNFAPPHASRRVSGAARRESSLEPDQEPNNKQTPLQRPVGAEGVRTGVCEQSSG